MADTPNNDIEKQLRDYAQQRRDAAGTPEMHRATRAMLQAEVKQRLGGTGTTTVPASHTGWAGLWPRLAFALGVIALLGVAAILLLPTDNKPKGNFELAKLKEPEPMRTLTDKSDVTPAAVPAPALASVTPPPSREVAATSAKSGPRMDFAAATSPAPSERRSTDGTVRTEPAKFKSAATRDMAKTPATSSTPAPTGGAVQSQSVGQGFFIAGRDQMKELKADTQPAANQFADSSLEADTLVARANKDAVAKPAARLAAAKKEESVAQTLGATTASQAVFNNNIQLAQRYRNVVAVEGQEQTAPPVLDEFTVTQTGEALTIVDRDGSVYKGFARQAPADRQAVNSANVESSNPIQLVRNSGNGGRAGATLNQSALNRAYEENAAPPISNIIQNLGGAQTVQMQNGIEPLNYVFRVEGTNRSLNQRVVFTGNIFQNTAAYNNAGYNFVNTVPNTVQNADNAQMLRPQQNALPSQNTQFNFNNAQQMPALNNNFINGRVQLNGKQPSELNALSVDR